MPGAKKKHLGTLGTWSEKLPRIGLDYPVTAIIAEERGGNPTFKLDKATRITTQEGKQLYLLRDEDEAMPAAEYETLYHGNNGEVLFLHSPRKGEYNPITFDFTGEDVETNIEQAAWNHWSHITQKEERQAWEQEESWWRENTEMLLLASAGFFFLLLGTGISFALKDATLSIQVQQQNAAAAENLVPILLAGLRSRRG